MQVVTQERQPETEMIFQRRVTEGFRWKDRVTTRAQTSCHVYAPVWRVFVVSSRTQTPAPACISVSLSLSPSSRSPALDGRRESRIEVKREREKYGGRGCKGGQNERNTLAAWIFVTNGCRLSLPPLVLVTLANAFSADADVGAFCDTRATWVSSIRVRSRVRERETPFKTAYAGGACESRETRRHA